MCKSSNLEDIKPESFEYSIECLSLIKLGADDYLLVGTSCGSLHIYKVDDEKLSKAATYPELFPIENRILLIFEMKNSEIFISAKNYGIKKISFEVGVRDMTIKREWKEYKNVRSIL